VPSILDKAEGAPTPNRLSRSNSLLTISLFSLFA